MSHHATMVSMTHHTQIPQPILPHTSSGGTTTPRKYMEYGKFTKSVEPTKIPHPAHGSGLDAHPFTSTRRKYRKTRVVVCGAVAPRVQFQTASDIAEEQEDLSPVNQSTQQRADDWEMVFHSDCAADNYDKASEEQESSLVGQNTVEGAGEAIIEEQGAQSGRKIIRRVIGKYFCL